MPTPSSTSSSERADVRRFAWRAGAFLLLQCVIAAAVVTPFLPSTPQTYLRAMEDKHDRLLNAPPPRLVLVGSSNFAFSWDSQMAKDQLGMNPINMGLHQGLGLPFVLNETSRNVKPTDVVVVSPEYLHFAFDSTSDTISEALIASPRATIAGTDVRIAQQIADKALALLGRRTRWLTLVAMGKSTLHPETPYRRDSLNEYGDDIAHRDMGPRPDRRKGDPLIYKPVRVETVIEMLNEFADACRARGATVYLAYPPYPQSEYARDQQTLARLDQTLRSELSFPVITEPDETIYPDEWFYDTEYHTLPEGTTRRTQTVIDHLKEVFAAPTTQ